MLRGCLATDPTSWREGELDGASVVRKIPSPRARLVRVRQVAEKVSSDSRALAASHMGQLAELQHKLKETQSKMKVNPKRRL